MSTPSQPMMVFERLRCQHGTRMLFDIPRLALSAGNAIVITGANGVGKTTLLRMLAGLAPANGATVDLAIGARGPQPLSPYPVELRARLTYVHQHPYLFRTSVRANLGYGLTTGAHRVPRADLAGRIDEAIRWAGLQHVVMSRPNTCPAARRSASHWHALAHCAPMCCCSMNQRRTWMAPRANRSSRWSESWPQKAARC